MSSSISEDLPMKSIKIRPEEKFSPRNLSRDLSIDTDDCPEVYYRNSSVGVPFLWESQPGTPKIKFRESRPLPPLTPPPSFLSNSKKPSKIHVKSSLIQSFLPKRSVKKSNVQHSPSFSSPSSSSSSSPWSSCSVPSSPFNAPISGESQQRILSPRMSLHSRIDEDEYVHVEEPVDASLCFSARRRSNAGSRHCSSKIIKLLLGEFA